jgi:hypothetical protein
MNAIWRFYQDEDRRWRWQQLAVDRSVLAESSKGHAEYEKCMSDAEGKGYVHVPAQGKLVRRSSR